MLKIKKAFTLAEMMVVMLILSIVLAAMAPVMTTRSRSDNSSPWRFSPNLSDAYFGAGDKQVALIGQQAVSEDGSDSDSKLLLNSSANTPKHILFKRAGTILGYLFMKDSNIALGNTEMNIANITGTDNIAIGAQTLANVTTGSNNVAVGADALSSSTTSSWNVAIGKNAFHNGTDGSNTIIGGDAMSQGTGANNVALGTNALYYGEGNGNVALGVNANHKTATLTTFTNSTAVGYAAYASGENSTAMGYTSNSTGSSSVSLGDSSIASEENAISIGHSSNASGSNSIAIGGSKSSTEITQATAENSIAIGTNSSAGDIRTIAIGPSAKSNTESAIAIGEGAIVKTTGTSLASKYSIAIGKNAQITGGTCTNGICTYGNSIAIGSDSNSAYSVTIAIGNSATVNGTRGIAIGFNAQARTNSVAIGEDACRYVTGYNKICIGKASGPASGSKWASDNYERIFIGG